MNVDGDDETKSEEGSHAQDASADITDKDSIELKSDEEISCGTDDDCPAYSWCSSDGRCGSWLDLWFQKPLRLTVGKHTNNDGNKVNLKITAVVTFINTKKKILNFYVK